MAAGKFRRGLKIFLIVLASVLALAVILGAVWCNINLNKNNLVKRYEAPAGQEVYIMGTFHKDHFVKLFNYSMEDVVSAVKNINPDVVFIEAREEYFKEYGVVDGPMDMSVVYSYCYNNGIPVEMIDWWIVDNEFKSNSTNDKRDDNIFVNIQIKLGETAPDKRVLIVCGAGHLTPQTARFKDNDFKKLKINNVPELFIGEGEFEYPVGTEDVWEKRAYFYAYTFPKIISSDDTLNDETKSMFVNDYQDEFYEEETKYCEIFKNNILFN